MVYRITNDCINCGVCKAECPADAVFAPGVNWRELSDMNFLFTGAAAFRDSYYSDKNFYIAEELCCGCKGYSDEPVCVIACPLGCIEEHEFFDGTKKSLGSIDSVCVSFRNSVKSIHTKHTGKEFRL